MTDDPVSDPDALVPFIEATTGSVYNIIDVREQTLETLALQMLS